MCEFVREYPVLSQTFVQSEIRELRAQGIPTRVVALEESGSVPSPASEDRPDLVLNPLWNRAEDQRGAARWFRLRHPARWKAFRHAVDMVRSESSSGPGGNRAAKAPALALQLQSWGVQVIHAQFGWHAASLAWMVSELLDVPWSLTLHAADIFWKPMNLSEKLQAADRVITVCEYNRRWLRTELSVVRPVDVVVCGVEVPVTPPEQSRPDIDVLAVGRLVPKKGFDTLIRAAAQSRILGNLSVQIVGDGPEERHLRRLADELGVTELVRLVGGRSHEEVLDLMSRSRVLCLPCRVAPDGDRDSMPVVVKEAMARAVPVVSTSEVGVPEMVTPECGILVAPDDPAALADALDSLLSAPARAQAMGQAGHQRVSGRFALSSEVNKLARIFSEMARRSKRDRKGQARLARRAAAGLGAVPRPRISSGQRNRWRQWQRILTEQRGLPGPDRARLMVSAAVDLLTYLIPALRAPNPRALATIRAIGGGGVHFETRRLTDDVYSVLPRRENDVHDAILTPLGPGATFVDCGANIGYYAVHAGRRVGMQGKVVAVEASPANAEVLRRNLTLNDVEATIVQAALSDGSGPATVRISCDRGAFGRASVARHGGGGMEVPTVTLDEICQDLAVVDVLKLDLEGSELSALRGGSSALRKTRRVVVEVNESRDEIQDLLTAAGFRVKPLAFTAHLLGER